MSDSLPSKTWRQRLEEDPDNYLLQRLAAMEEEQENPKPYVPLKSPETEESDPRILGREGDCDVALEALMEFYPSAEPYRLASDDNDFAHVFLVYKGEPLDICGTTTIEDLKKHYKDERLTAKPVNLQEIRRFFSKHRDSETHRRVRAHFRNYILQQREQFPP